jgi:hypothetical protein
MSDGQTHVQAIFVRQGACSGLEVPENTGKTLCQNWPKNRSEPLPQIQKTPIYRQILERRNSKNESKNGTKNDGQKYVQNRIRNDGHENSFEQGGH